MLIFTTTVLNLPPSSLPLENAVSRVVAVKYLLCEKLKINIVNLIGSHIRYVLE